MESVFLEVKELLGVNRCERGNWEPGMSVNTVVDNIAVDHLKELGLNRWPHAVGDEPFHMVNIFANLVDILSDLRDLRLEVADTSVLWLRDTLSILTWLVLHLLLCSVVDTYVCILNAVLEASKPGILIISAAHGFIERALGYLGFKLVETDVVLRRELLELNPPCVNTLLLRLLVGLHTA